MGVSGRSAQIWTPLVKACGASSESSGASHSENIAISTTNFTYEMNSHLAQGLVRGRGRLLTRVVPWPVVMPDGVNDTAVAPGAAATLASPPAAAVLAPPAPSPPPSHALVEHVEVPMSVERWCPPHRIVSKELCLFSHRHGYQFLRLGC